MMRLIDLSCTACEGVVRDHFQFNADEPLPRCENRVMKALISQKHPEVMAAGIGVPRSCGGRLVRTWLPTNRDNVIGDEIPGGVWIKNSLCNPDGTPKKYYSQTEIKKAAKERGYTQFVRHVPKPGSDKSPHTTKWDGPPVITEEERLARWYEHERELQESQHGR